MARRYLLVALVLLSPAAQADVYLCTDGAGRNIMGDQPPAECKDRDVRVIRPDGTVDRIIPAPLSPEQRRARDAEDQARARRYDEDHEWCRKYPDSLRCVTPGCEWSRKHLGSRDCRSDSREVQATLKP